MSEYRPTMEQLAAMWLFESGESMVIEAGAGTGKTSTLQLLAESTPRRGRYLAFNKAIVTDVSGKLPDNFEASTAHSLAFRAVGKDYAHRLGAARMRSRDIANVLGLSSWACRMEGGGSKRLSDGFLGGLVMRGISRYCQTAVEEPDASHVPFVPGLDPAGARPGSAPNNDRLAESLVGALRRGWTDLRVRDGRLPFRHDHYLKLWQLEHPRIDADVILFDEAQDANPVMAAVIAEQDHAQRVYVGDSCQAIYEFTGAVNALAEIDTDHRRFLTQSFRFGPAIADVANDLLAKLDAPLRLSGLDTIDSIVAAVDGDPDAVLCRTNAASVDTMLSAQRRGVKAHLVGGGSEVVAFARAAQDLMRGEITFHPELACFDSWSEVQVYVRDDAQGGELRLLTSLVEEYGVPTILEALEHMPTEEDAALIVSTAHKAKGREWDAVRVAADFADVGDAPGELRLRYVAFTRARHQLDISALAEEESPEPLSLEGKP